MAAWFGHTQTITSISKSVTTVASGILGLENNVTVFMQKVIYYDRFFQRVGHNLPPEVVDTARRLFARCYEYRDEIRDELESSLAYVADAGRWVIGMEDWNSKMEKRLVQISELVLLANTLLVEYSLTGKWGAEGAKNELSGYLRSIASSVVLRNDSSSEQKPELAITRAAASTDSQKDESTALATDPHATPLKPSKPTTTA
ncbi:hypothetical protein P43SY_006756 [Pythium insidiosum]|uniref:Uncharacterized protein n=1 Tax=Pythium insidiosum TaxID=114742 RepID=A0AAD5QAQ3_PYTIN|nr:hypothetical protein P43SY_006756 [Pythium insidiosum]